MNKKELLHDTPLFHILMLRFVFMVITVRFLFLLFLTAFRKETENIILRNQAVMFCFCSCVLSKHKSKNRETPLEILSQLDPPWLHKWRSLRMTHIFRQRFLAKSPIFWRHLHQLETSWDTEITRVPHCGEFRKKCYNNLCLFLQIANKKRPLPLYQSNWFLTLNIYFWI